MQFSLAKLLPAAPEINLDPWSEAWVTTILCHPNHSHLKILTAAVPRKKASNEGLVV